MSLIERPAGLQGPSGSPREAPAKNPSAGRRVALFLETPFAIVQRWILGTAWALRWERIARLLTVARIYMAHLLNPSRALLDAGLEFALTDRLSAGVSYSGQYADTVCDNAVKGRLTWLFN